MIEPKTVSLLESFLSGRISMAEFDEEIGDRLFRLRQDPEMTDEKELLSHIQLCLHEADEGSRDPFEVYMATQSALDMINPSKTIVESWASIYRDNTIPETKSIGTADLATSRS